MGCNFCQPKQEDQLNSFKHKENSFSTDEYLNYFKILGQEFIERKLKKTTQVLTNNFLKTKENLIINDKTKETQQRIKVWAQFQDQKQSDFKIQNFYIEAQLIFTPSIYYIFNINEHMTNAFANAKYQILDYTINENTAVIICHTKTNKYWLFDERNFVLVRIIRLLDDGSIIEFQQSISLNQLRNCENFLIYQKNLKNLGTIYESYIYYQFQVGGYRMKQFYKVDYLQSITLRLAKNFIKTKIFQFHKKQNKKIINFLLTFRDWYKLIWFTTSRTNFEKIFNQNLLILKNSDFDLKKYNQEALKDLSNTEEIDLTKIASRRKNTDISSIKEEKNLEKQIFGNKPFGDFKLNKCKTEYRN